MPNNNNNNNNNLQQIDIFMFSQLMVNTPLYLPLRNVSEDYSCANRPEQCESGTECADLPGSKSRCEKPPGKK